MVKSRLITIDNDIAEMLLHPEDVNRSCSRIKGRALMVRLASFQEFKPFHQLLHNIARGGRIPPGREKKTRAWNTAPLFFRTRIRTIL